MSENISRRELLCGLALIGLTTPLTPSVAASGYKVLSNGKVEFTLAANPALKKVGGVVRVDGVNGGSIALVRTSNAANGFSAVKLQCTHQGGSLKQQGNQWACQVHGATFTLAGKNIAGLATTPLKTLPIKATAKKITVG